MRAGCGATRWGWEGPNSAASLVRKCGAVGTRWAVGRARRPRRLTGVAAWSREHAVEVRLGGGEHALQP
eukprot:4878280-Prymnesium_polylepis.1